MSRENLIKVKFRCGLSGSSRAVTRTFLALLALNLAGCVLVDRPIRIFDFDPASLSLEGIWVSPDGSSFVIEAVDSERSEVKVSGIEICGLASHSGPVAVHLTSSSSPSPHQTFTGIASAKLAESLDPEGRYAFAKVRINEGAIVLTEPTWMISAPERLRDRFESKSSRVGESQEDGLRVLSTWSSKIFMPEALENDGCFISSGLVIKCAASRMMPSETDFFPDHQPMRVFVKSEGFKSTGCVDAKAWSGLRR